MKRKIALVLTAGMLSVSLFGCSGKQASGNGEPTGEASNEYVTVSGYNGIQVDKVDKAEEVTDEEIESYIQSILSQNATDEEVTGRAVQEGDTATIDYVGKMGGEEFEGGSAEDYPLVIGSGNFIDGFEDSVVGHEIGDTYDWNGKFPDDYTSTDLAGKDVVFTITVKGISQSKTPELTDEFVKTVSDESETVDQYRAEVKKTLEETAQENYQTALNAEVWAAVLDKAEVLSYPEDEVSKTKNLYIDQYKQAAEYYGMDYEEFVLGNGASSLEEFEQQADDAARTSIKGNQVAQAIAEAEGLTPTDEEFEQKMEEMAEQYGYESVDAMKEVADDDTLRGIILQNVVTEWLAEHCVQVEPAEDEDADSADSAAADDAGSADTAK